MKNKLYNLKFNKFRRRELRNNMTEAEIVLWRELRNKKLGCKFRRQFGIGPYIVDFFCTSAKLILEVDGEIHDEAERIKEDKKRQEYLESRGFRVKRYRNGEVINNLQGVIDDIKCNLEEIS